MKTIQWLRSKFTGLPIFLCTTLFAQPALPPNTLLDFFRFPTNFYTQIGYPPLAYTNVESVPVWALNALLIGNTNTAPSYVKYRIIETNGFQNLAFTNGSIFFLFSGNWASADTNKLGTGPGARAYFLSAGDTATNAPHGTFWIYADAGGTNIYFGGMSNSISTNYISAPISWASNTWHSIGCEYSSSNSFLYLDDYLAATGSGVSIIPGTNSWTNGMTIGADSDGFDQSRGAFWNLQTWNVELGGFYTNFWSYRSAQIATWQGTSDGGGFEIMGGHDSLYYDTPTYSFSTNYKLFTNFWLTVPTNNSGTQLVVTIDSTLSNLTYQVLTNTNVATPVTNWNVWQTIVATNSVTVAPPFNLGTNSMFFASRLLLITGTNGLPDWWQMNYFGHLGIDPSADPMQDRLNNLQKYQMGLDPNVSYLSQLSIEPPGGTNLSMPSITIFSLTNGATIRYTLDGSTPSSTHGFTTISGVPLTDVPATNFTLKAWEAGLIGSPASAVFSIVAGAPTISRPSGIYISGTTLQISALPTVATVRYTTNGSSPTTNSPSIQATNLIALTTNQTISATAWYNGVAGPTTSANYIIPNAPTNDNFSNAVQLVGASGEFLGTTVGSTIEAFESDDIWHVDSTWYKWVAPSNGTLVIDFSRSSNSYYLDPFISYFGSTNTDPTNLWPTDFTLDSDDWLTGTATVVSNTTYYIRVADILLQAPIDILWDYYGPTLTPIFSPDSGTYTNTQLVFIQCNDPVATMHYTTNGVDPTESDRIYNPVFPVVITTNLTLKAAAWRIGLPQSAVCSAAYTINLSATNPTITVATPSLSPASTNFASSLVVTLTCTNAGVAIHYTLNGTIPTLADPSVSSGGTVTISNTAVFNAKGWVTNMNASAVSSIVYAKQNTDSDHDQIPDTAEILIGSNPLLGDSNGINSNPFAHGLDNLQVYLNPSVLLADNYSTPNDGVPDWWKIAHGFSITTSAALVGANGQTLLASYLDNLNPADPMDQPSGISKIDFHVVAGTSNHIILVLDRILPNVFEFTLRYTDMDSGSPTYNETFQTLITTNMAISIPGQPVGRYYSLPDPQPADGIWNFQLFGMDAAHNRSKLSSCYSTLISRTIVPTITFFPNTGTETTATVWITNDLWAMTASEYTNNSSDKLSALTQLLRASSTIWRQSIGQEDTSLNLSPAWSFPWDVYTPLASNYWAIAQFDSSLNFVAASPYFNSYSSTGEPWAGGYIYDSSATFGPLTIDRDSSNNPVALRMQTDTNYLFNQYGLKYISLEVSTNGGTPIVMYPGDSVALHSGQTINVAQNVETPVFHTTGYYFDSRLGPMYDSEGGGWDWSMPPIGDATLVPGWQIVKHFATDNFVPVAQTNPMIVAQVGKPVNLESWRRLMAFRPNGQAIPNQHVIGENQHYADMIDSNYWIAENLDQAFLCDPSTDDVPRTSQTNYDGRMKIDTTNAIKTGFVSPNLPLGVASPPGATYNAISAKGQFTPTQPGKIIVTTKPDTNGYYGEVVIYVIDMQVDANHDGVMDNRDLTSLDGPMTFWVNNNYDRPTNDKEDNVVYDDDVETAPTADYYYKNKIGHDAIPSVRDLEDYARLWIPGFSNLLADLPTNYTVTFQWRNQTGASIRLFCAAETNGGTNYLADATIGGIQTNEFLSPFVGYVGTASLDVTEQLENRSIANDCDHFIFSGGTAGNDELVLQVKNQCGGLAGEASIFLNLEVIKRLYERWTVGDDPAVAPTSIAVPAYDNGVTSILYPYNAQRDSQTPYILFVHGWNMRPWEKDRFAESAFKRLYWQGYQGRFGIFRWPTDSGFEGNWSALTDPRNFDSSELQAWKSATGLKNRLIALNIQYSGNVYLLAHSMGNVVAGEALRLAGNTNLVNTYVASQGAITAHTYDSTITNALQFTFTYPTEPLHTLYGNKNYGPDTPNIYGNWLATNSAAVGRRINFYNVNDYALAMSRWGYDQITKPDISGYGYLYLFDGYPQNSIQKYHTGSPDDDLPWNHFRKGLTSGTSLLDITVLTNRYEIMAFAAEPRVTALGSTPGTANFFGVNLTQVWPSDPSGLSFSDHFWHSGEFRGDYWQQKDYWKELLGADAFTLKP